MGHCHICGLSLTKTSLCGSYVTYHCVTIAYSIQYSDMLYRFVGNLVPLQAWSGLEHSRKLRFPDFMTTAHDGGKVVSLMHRPPLPPGNTPGTHFC